MKQFFLLATFSLALSSCGSLKSVAPIHPGAINTVDSSLYDSLLTAQTTIEGLKANIAQYPNLKQTLNRAIALYDAAEDSYKAYHKIIAAGGTADSTQITAQVNSLLLTVGSVTGEVKAANKK